MAVVFPESSTPSSEEARKQRIAAAKALEQQQDAQNQVTTGAELAGGGSLLGAIIGALPGIFIDNPAIALAGASLGASLGGAAGTTAAATMAPKSVSPTQAVGVVPGALGAVEGFNARLDKIKAEQEAMAEAARKAAVPELPPTPVF